MEDETQTSTVEVPVKVADGVKSDADSIAPPVKVEGDQDVTVTNGELHQEEETALDGEFIKVEKESLEGKDSSHMDKAIAVGGKEFTSLDSSSNSLVNTGILEAQEKVKTLELELERVAKALQDSESEKARLNDEAHVAKEKLDERDKQCEELEINQKRLHEKFTEAEDRYASQLKTLQETVGAHESKEKELIEVKEAFHGISTELESSRKKMQELDQELISSAEQAHKYEELHKQSGSHAESETQKALEFERMLEVAKLSAKEMEDQMASLQEEVKGLYEKILENQKVEEVLKSTSVQLSEAQAEQELFKQQVTELEQKLASGEAVIKELSQDLNLHKASESQMKEDIQALENLFSVAKEDLQLKSASLEENELKLLEEIKTREKVEHSLKIQEEKIFSMQEELMKVSGEKAALEVATAELNGNVLKMKDLCGDLEARLKVSDENFSKADGLHSQALLQNIELEEKLKSLEELHQESGSVAATTTQRNLELEDIIRASSAAEEEAKSQLREIEMRLISAEEKNLELERQINLAELRNIDADKELKGFSEKTAELTAILRGNEEESAKLKIQLQEYEEKVVQLESALSQSSLKHSELEQELKDLVQKSADHEGQVHSTRQRSLELEDMIQLSNSKAEGAGKKVGEMELLLETANYRIQELEEQIKISETKCANTEVESKQYSDKLSEVGEELEAFQVKVSSLEIALQSSLEKEQQLMESLNVITEEKKTLEEAAQIANEKVSEFQNLMEILQNELKLTQDKLVNIEKDLNSSNVRENEIMEKLKSAEEQLEQQGKVIEQATAKNTELELLHESLVKDSDLKLQEAMVSFTSRDSEAKDLYQKVTSLEDQLAISKQQEIETAERETSLKAQLEESLTKVATLETTIGELQSKVSEAETTAGQSLSECELLVETNLKLKQELESHQIKVNELQELLNGFHAEKENTRELLGSHVKTITELTDQNSRALELQSVTEFQIKEAEIQLHQAIEKFTHRDSEAKELNEKLSSLEVQVKTYEEQVHESATLAESRKLELEEALLKLKNAEGILEQLQIKADQFGTENESLAEVNLKLTQELAAYETKMSELQTTLNKILVEKEETVEQLHSSTKTIEDLTQQLAAEEQRLQSQISSLMEENNLLTKTYQDAKEEFHILIAETEAQLNEQKTKEEVLSAEVENLKTGMAEKSVMQTRVAELEQQLILADTRLKEEVESIKAVSAEKEAGMTSKLEDHARKLAERDLVDEQLGQLQKELSLAHTTIAEKKEAEIALKHSLEEVEAKHQQAVLLEKQVEELEQKVQLAESKYKQKEVEEGNKLALANEEMDELKKKLSEQTELEKKIEALENQLKLAKTKPEEQIKGVQSEVKDALEVKSRDLGSSISTPKRKSKKRSEATQSSEVSPAISTQTTNSSSAMSFKFIIGVALVSVIIGVILGKRY